MLLRCNTISCKNGLFHQQPSQRVLYVMLNSLRLQPVVADQARRASASGWSVVSGTGCDLKPASKEAESQTYTMKIGKVGQKFVKVISPQLH